MGSDYDDTVECPDCGGSGVRARRDGESEAWQACAHDWLEAGRTDPVAKLRGVLIRLMRANSVRCWCDENERECSTCEAKRVLEETKEGT